MPQGCSQKTAQDNIRDNRLALEPDSTNSIIVHFCTKCGPVFFKGPTLNLKL